MRIVDAITLLMVQDGLLEAGRLEGERMENALYDLVRAAGLDRSEPLDALFLEVDD